MKFPQSFHVSVVPRIWIISAQLTWLLLPQNPASSNLHVSVAWLSPLEFRSQAPNSQILMWLLLPAESSFLKASMSLWRGSPHKNSDHGRPDPHVVAFASRIKALPTTTPIMGVTDPDVVAFASRIKLPQSFRVSVAWLPPLEFRSWAPNSNIFATSKINLPQTVQVSVAWLPPLEFRSWVPNSQISATSRIKLPQSFHVSVVWLSPLEFRSWAQVCFFKEKMK